MGNLVKQDIERRGRYRLVPPGPHHRKWALVFEALCHEPCCGARQAVDTGRSGTVAVPNLLRQAGWSMTGATTGARWWCPRHRQR